MTPFSIDLNCDMGESFGAYSLGNDFALMDYVSSVNIACGFHAGDAQVMQKTVAHAAKKNIAIGAHPSFPDLQGFGRRMMTCSAEEIYNMVVYQVGALQGFCSTKNVKLHHVKPHGALYNLSAKDKTVAAAIAKAVFDIDQSLILYGLSHSVSISEAQKMGLKTASEVFADRSYQSDGSLTPRQLPNAVLQDETEVIQQTLQFIFEKKVKTTQHELLDIQADTLCIHGDHPNALAFVKKLRAVFLEKGIVVKSL
jgi:5-oxoprolinase (ATP-hydrolysing) subunit A